MRKPPVHKSICREWHGISFARPLCRRIPRPLLLLLKTNDCLRAIDLGLGQPINTFAVTARHAARALAEATDPAERADLGVGGWGWKWRETARVEALVLGLRLASWISGWRQWALQRGSYIAS